jgi:hypothetical protein
VRADALELRMRPRSAWEAADLGIRFAQRHWRALHACHAAVAVPVIALCVATHEIAGWLPLLLLFLSKPWLDRSCLFVLSRAAFGQHTSLGDLWRQQRQVLWRQLFLTWTWRRLSPWRSFTQPIYQLEGSKVALRRRQLGRRYRGPALAVTSMFSLVESFLVVALTVLIGIFMPDEPNIYLPPLPEMLAATFGSIYLPVLYGLVMLLLEPFYVAAGFAMYLNRRTELEAWDVEQELRRAFAS